MNMFYWTRDATCRALDRACTAEHAELNTTRISENKLLDSARVTARLSLDQALIGK
jgi:hypothetical protein